MHIRDTFRITKYLKNHLVCACNTFQENLLRFRRWKIKGYVKKFTVRSFVSANAVGLNEREKRTEIIEIKLDDRIARVHPMTFSSPHVHTYLLATIARVHTCYKRFVTFSKATSRPGSPTFSHLVASILGVRLHMHGMQPLTDKHAWRSKRSRLTDYQDPFLYAFVLVPSMLSVDRLV